MRTVMDWPIMKTLLQKARAFILSMPMATGMAPLFQRLFAMLLLAMFPAQMTVMIAIQASTRKKTRSAMMGWIMTVITL
jgi:hypothetical protein